MNKQLPIFIIIALILTAGAIYGFMYVTKSSENDSMMKQEVNEESTMMEKKAETGEPQSMMESGYNGKILVDAETPFVEFTQKDYEKALADGKVVILDFYADWCPICRGEAPVLEQGFRSLNNPDVIGFRVNYNDTETDADEEALAKKYGVTYQHTKVIIKDGTQVLKDGQVWDAETFVEQVNSVL
jgi:thioredoxin 1